MNIIKCVKDDAMKMIADAKIRDGYNHWDEHIKYVVEHALKLAKEYKADSEIVEIAALLHDIAIINNVGTRADHHINSAKIASKLLKKYKYDNIKIERIEGCILNHRSSKNANNIDELCVADADILAHFSNITMTFQGAFGRAGLPLIEGRKALYDYFMKDYDDLSVKTKKSYNNEFNNIMKVCFGNYNDEESKEIIKLNKDILKKNNTKLIAINGLSASGKTTLANNLKTLLPNSFFVSIDEIFWQTVKDVPEVKDMINGKTLDTFEEIVKFYLENEAEVLPYLVRSPLLNKKIESRILEVINTYKRFSIPLEYIITEWVLTNQLESVWDNASVTITVETPPEVQKRNFMLHMRERGDTPEILDIRNCEALRAFKNGNHVIRNNGDVSFYNEIDKIALVIQG